MNQIVIFVCVVQVPFVEHIKALGQWPDADDRGEILHAAGHCAAAVWPAGERGVQGDRERAVSAAAHQAGHHQREARVSPPTTFFLSF